MDYKEKYEKAYKLLEQIHNGGVVSKTDIENTFPELKTKSVIDMLKIAIVNTAWLDCDKNKCLSWLEKQGEKQDYNPYKVTIKSIATMVEKYANGDLKDFYNNVKVKCKDAVEYDKTWNEKQGEQKPIDKVEPKFHEGEWLCENEPNNYARFIQILETVNVQGKERYRISRDIHNDEDIVEFDFVEKYYHKFDIIDAKDGDVLYINNTMSESIMIYKSFNNGVINKYASYNKFGFEGENYLTLNDGYITPATKEQRDTLMKAMADAGYTFNFKKKELKKIDNKEVNGDDYGVDGLWHAKTILEKTLGKVEGYQSDDGILEHKYAIDVVKNLYEQNPAWSEEDEFILKDAITAIDITLTSTFQESNPNLYKSFEVAKHWLKSLKPQLHWKPTQEQMNCFRQAIDLFKMKVNDDIVLRYLNSLYEQLKKLKSC